ncbi:hypothetical protein TWF730_000099 [Orbilia blumenaviensis]|uniref:Wax synthase domain-containing protein n=1 Tax=Orbilia blumenaviensis TaxID=1796055 RepID=A0AAV9VKJ0_9PEZI
MAPPGGTTLINWNFCTFSVFLFVPTYFLTLLLTSTLIISTPKGSLTRYASLPIIGYLCLRIFNYGLATFPKNTVGIIDWAGSAYNCFLITSTLLYLEGIDASDPVISKPVNSRPPGYFIRLWRGLTYCVNARGINTPYQIKNVPAFDSKRPGWVPSRRRFLVTNLAWLVFLFLAQDLFYCQELAVEDELKLVGISRENLIWRHPEDGPITGEEIGSRVLVSMLMWSMLIPIAVNLQYTFLSVLAVGLGISEPKNWPPPFGSPTDSYTLRLFWGKFWHQTLRWHFSKPAQFITHAILRLPKTGLIQRYVNVYGVFLISGLWHAGQSWMIYQRQGPEAQRSGWNREFFFFTVMATGIMIEDGVQWLFQSKKVRSKEEKEGLIIWKRVAGYIWVWGLLILVAPVIDYPKFRIRLETWLPAHPLIVFDPEWASSK